MKVLLVDDDKLVSKALCILLQEEGFEVIECLSGLQALDLVTTFQFDLLVSDVLMPEIDGYRLCKMVRSLPNRKNLPIMLFSGQPPSGMEIEVAQMLGADVYVRPNDLQKFRQSVRNLKVKIEECGGEK